MTKELNTKYTSDGRKVIVVGKLNSEQHIVQEIFVCDGQEVPSGENFVVSSLHDAPAESWKEKNLRELEARYEETKRTVTARIDACDEKLTIAEEKAKQRAGALLAFARNSDNEQLQTLHAFLAGEITHFFIDGYSPKIVSWDDNEAYCAESSRGYFDIKGMKLISIFGCSKGKLDYRIDQYRDGSGGSQKRIIPCKSYEHALAEAQQSLDASADKYLSGEQRSLHVDGWLKIDGIQIPADALKKYNGEKREKQLARLDKLRTDAVALEAEIADGDSQ